MTEKKSEKALNQELKSTLSDKVLAGIATLFAFTIVAAIANAILRPILTGDLMNRIIPSYVEKFNDDPISSMIGIAFFTSLIGLLGVTTFIQISGRNEEDKFVDIDKRAREKTSSSTISKIRMTASESSEDLNEYISGENDIYHNYESYFDSIRNVLTDQVRIADEKASNLLDKGTKYAKWGISFYLISIVAWQFLSLQYGYQDHYLYGIISCSLLFVFIEFLAAWYLKQYRHFIDTSTYTIKIKSIFDKYMLSNLLSQSFDGDTNSIKEHNTELLRVQGRDISWPEMSLSNNPDINLVKEFLETVTQNAKAIRSEGRGIS